MNKLAESASIVLIGAFNPSIFHPFWFEKQSLLPATETDAAKIEVVSSDVSIISFPWFRLEVLRERFIVRTTDESKLGPLRDLALGVLRLLEHTPINQVGMNRDVIFKLADQAEWHIVGDRLAPKVLWQPVVSNPGLLSMTMQGKRSDDLKGYVGITVKSASEASVNSVAVGWNDHIQLDDNSTALEAATLIEANWDDIMNRALTSSKSLITSTLN